MLPRFRPLALALLALHVAVSLPGALRRAVAWTAAAAARAGEDRPAVERRMKGAAYSEEIARIRRLLPPDAAYALVAGGPEIAGEGNWVRYDLAPRRAVYLGQLRALPGPVRMNRRMSSDLRYVVITGAAGAPPVLFERESFLRALRHRRRGRS